MFTYNLMITKKSAHVIIIVLIATTAGASDGGLTKSVVLPIGGSTRGISDKGIWLLISVSQSKQDALDFRHTAEGRDMFSSNQGYVVQSLNPIT